MKNTLLFFVLLLFGFTLYGCASQGEASLEVEDQQDNAQVVNLFYGLDKDAYEISEGVVGNGESLSAILTNSGVTMSQIDYIDRNKRDVFDARKIRSGNKYYCFNSLDSIHRLEHFVYEHTITEYITFSFVGDSISVTKTDKPVDIRRKQSEGVITSSLWNAMVDAGSDPMLAMDLSEIYAWSIDFFALQKNDRFNVVYETKYVDSTQIGIGKILAASFFHDGKEYLAIPFEQDGKLSYWDENGKSLRKNFLKAPLKYSRISSKFSNSRLHPILRIRRPHYGVDYAAPSGTHVFAVGDGVITYKGYKGANGNMIKIKHTTGGFESMYLHLKGYAKGINVGTRVRQGELIGYVGSTGSSTGPHLDFRITRNGQPIDPLKIPTEPAEPLRKENMEIFNVVKARVMGTLKGEINIDSLDVSKPENILLDTMATKQLTENEKH